MIIPADLPDCAMPPPLRPMTPGEILAWLAALAGALWFVLFIIANASPA
jgi:hypothetical protein